MNKNKITCASFFSGVGGIDRGFEDTTYFKTIYANELNEYAIQTFEANFQLKVENKDIRDVNEQKLPKFDVLLAGFPCQPFSIAGNREGFADKKGRGNLFFELIRIIKYSRPQVVFLENVKNYLSHDNGRTMNVTLELLNNLGYHVVFKILNSKDYANVPQNRERIYIIGFKEKRHLDNFSFPKPVRLTKNLKDILNNNKVDEKFYYKPDECYFYDELKKGIKRKDTLYQWRRVYLRENKSNLSPTLTANMGSGGHNVPIVLSDYGFRKLTPDECFRLQGFSSKFKLPSSLSSSKLYMQAGNSVVVPLVRRIALQIYKAITNF